MERESREGATCAPLIRVCRYIEYIDSVLILLRCGWFFDTSR